jgi:amino acid permease
MAREPLLGAADELKPELLSVFAPALFNTLKSILGTGLLAIPHEFAGVGITAGLVLTAVVGTWSCYTMHLIAHCTLLANATGGTAVATFGELVGRALGPRTGAVLGTSNLVLHQLLACAAYMVFVGDTLEQAHARCMHAACTALTLRLHCTLHRPGARAARHHRDPRRHAALRRAVHAA